MDRHTGAILGFYRDSDFAPFQELQLTTVSTRTGFTNAGHLLNKSTSMQPTPFRTCLVSTLLECPQFFRFCCLLFCLNFICLNVNLSLKVLQNRPTTQWWRLLCVASFRLLAVSQRARLCVWCTNPTTKRGFWGWRACRHHSTRRSGGSRWHVCTAGDDIAEAVQGGIFFDGAGSTVWSGAQGVTRTENGQRARYSSGRL